MNCTKCTNTRCFIKNNCTESWLSYVQANKVANNFIENKTVFYEGEVVRGIYVVCSGKLMVLFKEDHKDKIVRLAGKGQILGHRGFYEDMVYPVSAKTITESEVAFITSDDFMKLLRKNSDLSFYTIMFFASELLNSDKKLKLQSSNSTTDKVLFALSLVLFAFGYKNKTKKVVDLGLSIEEFSRFAGVSTPGLNKALLELDDEAILFYDGNEIVIKDESKFGLADC